MPDRFYVSVQDKTTGHWHPGPPVDRLSAARTVKAYEEQGYRTHLIQVEPWWARFIRQLRERRNRPKRENPDYPLPRI